MTSSSANTSSLKRLVRIFTCHVLGTIGWFGTHSFYAPSHNPWCLSRQYQNSCSTLSMEWYTFLIFFVSWSQSAMFTIVCFRISQNPCINLHCQHLLGHLEWNFSMCHWESWHLISNINVVWVTPCSTDVIDTPMCAQVDFDARARNGVVGFVKIMGVTIWPMRQVKFLLGGSKQLRPL